MAKKTTKKEANADLTLAALSEKYLAHMEREGKSPGTVASYTMELKLAQGELGADTLVADIKAYDITRFESCDRVVKLRSGKPKSQLSIDKTRRVLRLACAWAATSGLIATTPYAQTATDEPPAPEKPKRKRRGVELEVSQPEAERAADQVEPTLAAPAG